MLSTRVHRTMIAIMSVIAIASVATQEPRKQQDSAELPPLTFELTPGVEFPFDSARQPLYNISYGTHLLARLRFPGRLGIAPAAGLVYTLAPIRAETSISAVAAAIGGGVTYDFGRFEVSATGLGGGYFSFFNSEQRDAEGEPYPDQSGAALYADVGVEGSVFLTPYLGVGLGGVYHNYFGLMHGMKAYIGTKLYLSGFREQVRVQTIEMDSVFPALLQYYGDHSFGHATITNEGRFAANDVELGLYVRNSMTSEQRVEVADVLLPGATLEIPLHATFDESILGFVEGARLPARITVTYEMNGRRKSLEVSRQLRLHNRNAMTWDDDRKAAAFVTAKDSEVIRYASEIASVVRQEGPHSVNGNLRVAMGMFDSLAADGLSYVIDPNTPAYVDASANTQIVDFLQFPRQTFHYRGGDCDDLTTLYCSLLEAVGVHTAFVTIPGHVFAAFSLSLSPEEAKRFLPGARYFEHEGEAWIPVEVTLLNETFLRAWEVGAKEYATHEANGDARVYPMRENWRVYPSAGWDGEGVVVEGPRRDAVAEAYRAEMDDFIRRQLDPQVEAIRDALSQSRSPVRLLNRLGVLYAQYGLVDEAKEVFEEVLAENDHYPAMVNLANIYYLEEELPAALSLLERAATIRPDDRAVLLAMTRINHEMGSYARVRALYARLEEVAPDLSDEFAYLSVDDESTSRADIASPLARRIVWAFDAEGEEP